MTVGEKEKVAKFLDIAGDYLGSGYAIEKREYQFEDTKTETVNAKTSEVSNTDSIEKIAEEIRSCKDCVLCEKRLNAAPGEGVLNPVVMVIGEGPGEDEDKQGRPFVGKAGQQLDKMLAAINLSRETNCFIANVVKCRPPENRDPRPEETAACAHFLERQILLLKPKFILIAGKIAAQTLLKSSGGEPSRFALGGGSDSISKMRGKFYNLEIADSIFPAIATYHPAALLRSDEYKRPAWEDLKLLRSRIES